MSAIQPNKRFARRKAKPEEVTALLDMYAKNKHLKTLVKTFDLDIKAVEVGTAHEANTDEIIIKNKKQMGTKKKFDNEATDDFEQIDFIVLKEDKAIECITFGEFKMIDPDGKGAKKCFIVEIDGEKKLLPSNIQLVRKIENVVKVCADRLTIGVEMQITDTGLQKVENVANKMRVYSVKY